MPQIRPATILPLAALKFGTATSDTVNCGSDASLDDLTAGPCTFLALVYSTGVLANRRILSKSANITTQRVLIATSGIVGNIQVIIGHATQSLIYTTSDTPLGKLSGWYWVVCVIDLSKGAGERAVFYTAGMPGTLRRNTVTVTEPTGARGSDAAASFWIANDAAAATNVFPGSIALAAAWNRALSFAELARLTKGGGTGFRESNPVGLWRPGWQGKCSDESGNGNHGTITGAVQSGVWPRL